MGSATGVGGQAWVCLLAVITYPSFLPLCPSIRPAQTFRVG